MLHQVQLLMDDADAERLRRARVTDVDLFAKILDRTAVALVDTGQDLHQCRLARAVFTDQRHDLPLAHFQLRIVQRMHSGEVFLDALHPQNDLAHPNITFLLLTDHAILSKSNRFPAECTNAKRFVHALFQLKGNRE